MEKIHEIVQASAALEGSTLSQAECSLLLEKGLSTQNKTISEQLLCLNLRDAYVKCKQMSAAHEFWSAYRIKSIAAIALKDTATSNTSNEASLQRICNIANEQRLHVNDSRRQEIYHASFNIHYIISSTGPWGRANNFMARLLMNYLQYECNIEPTIIRPSQRAEYGKILSIALEEDISEIFVSYMMDHSHDKPEKETSAVVPEVGVPGPGPITTPAPERGSSRVRILRLLTLHPYMTTADLAKAIGISNKGVEKQLGILKGAGALKRIGPDKGGHWQVL